MPDSNEKDELLKKLQSFLSGKNDSKSASQGSKQLDIVDMLLLVATYQIIDEEVTDKHTGASCILAALAGALRDGDTTMLSKLHSIAHSNDSKSKSVRQDLESIFGKEKE